VAKLALLVDVDQLPVLAHGEKVVDGVEERRGLPRARGWKPQRQK
jgi:hypothetical protein